MRYHEADGGRANAGFRGDTGDCVTRAIAIATGQPYRKTYNDLKELSIEMTGGLEKAGRDGCESSVSHRYLLDRGWILELTPGQYLKDLPNRRDPIIAVMPTHLACVINHTVYDSHDCRESRRTKCKSPTLVGYYREFIA